jgi:3',5'-cyclic AMP phosphodiesterase CpdA
MSYPEHDLGRSPRRIAWLTDIHLNFVRRDELDAFFQHVSDANPDIVLISGDIAESRDLYMYLRDMAAYVRRPIYFVLGNHDYYGASIAQVRRHVREFSADTNFPAWLPEAGIVELGPMAAVVGHDGWADARLGDYDRSEVMLNDYVLIQEFVRLSKRDRRELMTALADEAANYLGRVLPEALSRYPHVFVVTHVPPLREACWHEGRISDDDWLPHFACQAVGTILLEVMKNHPGRQVTVLCGHTHSAGETRPLPNLTILTGGSRYGQPRVQRVFELE